MLPADLYSKYPKGGLSENHCKGSKFTLRVSGLIPFSITLSQIPELCYPLTQSTGGATKKEFLETFFMLFSLLPHFKSLHADKSQLWQSLGCVLLCISCLSIVFWWRVISLFRINVIHLQKPTCQFLKITAGTEKDFYKMNSSDAEIHHANLSICNRAGISVSLFDCRRFAMQEWVWQP